jgi:hypothetical protein
MFYRTELKHLHNLPPGTANAGVFLIFGLLPATVILARNVLTTFVNLLRDSDFIESQIIRRQLAVKNMDSKSNISMVRDLLLQYDLPSIFKLCDCSPTKTQWKSTLKRRLSEVTFAQLRQEASKKRL